MGMIGKANKALGAWSQKMLAADPLGMGGAAPWQTVVGALADAAGGTADMVNQYVANPILNAQAQLSGTKGYQFPTGSVQAAVPQPKGMIGRGARATLAMATPGGEASAGLRAAEDAAQTIRQLHWGETAQQQLVKAQRVLSQHGGVHPEALQVANDAADALGMPRIDASKTLPVAAPELADLRDLPPATPRGMIGAMAPTSPPQISGYHGTTGDFDGFALPGRTGRATGGRKTGGNATYIAQDPSTANYFARGDGANVRKVVANPGPIFDPANPDHLAQLEPFIRQNFGKVAPGALYGPDTAMSFLKSGDYGLLEQPPVEQWMKKNGYGAVKMEEQPGKATWAVFDPSSIEHAPFGQSTPTPAPPAPQMVAYHGSPHTFDSFDASKIGTGEGNQTFGHGLYFAENPDTARSYRDALTPDANMTVGGQSLMKFTSGLETRADSAPMPQAQQLYDRLAVAHNLWNTGDVKGVQDIADQHGPAAMDWFNNEVAPNFSRDGHLYQVGINADPDHFLDWDAGLHQQSPHVQQALQQFGIHADPEGMAAHTDALLNALRPDGDASAPIPREPWDPSGGAIYESSKIVPGGYRDPAAASQALQQAGIPGIKYLDQGSRPDGSGTRNFVVFDPSMVDVLKRYAVPGTIGAGGALWGASQDQPPSAPAASPGPFDGSL